MNGSEMIRYNPSSDVIEFSKSKGLCWFNRGGRLRIGRVRALTLHKGELILCSDQGVYFSKSNGFSWFLRSHEKDFVDMQSMGDNLVAFDSKGRTHMSSDGFYWYVRGC